MAVNINVPSQVKNFANLAAFPASGAVKTIYIAEDTNKTYRWTGSVYVEISASAAMTWGQIGGTLSNQTDLQNALDAKVATSRTLTINGTTQDLSANRTFNIPTDLTVGTTPISSGTNGRVLFQGTGNVLQQSSSLSFDSATNRFQVGSNVNILAANTFPTNLNSPYVVLGPYNANFGGDQGALFNLTNNSTTGNSAAIFRFGITSPATGAIGEFGATSSTFSGFPSLVFFNTKGTFPLAFLTNDTERLRIHGTTGNVLINTTTDAGFRLDVNGTARVSGAVRIAASGLTNTIATFSSASGSANIISFTNTDTTIQGGISAMGSSYNYGTYQPNQLNLSGSTGGIGLRTSNGANAHIRFYSGNADGDLSPERMRLVASTGNLLINTTTDAGFRLDVNGTARVSSNFQANANVIFGTSNGFYWDSANQRLGLGTNSPQVVFHIQTGTSEKLRLETSGTIGNFVTFYNSGVRKGYLGRSSSNDDLVYFNEAATGNLIFGSNGTERMRIKSNGVINMSAIPTSPVGLSSGDLWNNLGILTIV